MKNIVYSIFTMNDKKQKQIELVFPDMSNVSRSYLTEEDDNIIYGKIVRSTRAFSEWRGHVVKHVDVVNVRNLAVNISDNISVSEELLEKAHYEILKIILWILIHGDLSTDDYLMVQYISMINCWNVVISRSNIDTDTLSQYTFSWKE